MFFYLPPSPERNDLKTLIERHGGAVTEIHECFTYQIAPLSAEVPLINFFHGDIFMGHWIVDSIQAGRLLDMTDYFAMSNSEKGSKRVDFIPAKVRYTIMETIKIFELAVNNSKSARGSTFWLKIQREGILPVRPGESMRNHWKEKAAIGLEVYITQAVADETRYCHAFAPIPVVNPGYMVTEGPQHQAWLR